MEREVEVRTIENVHRTIPFEDISQHHTYSCHTSLRSYVYLQILLEQYDRQLPSLVPANFLNISAFFHSSRRSLDRVHQFQLSFTPHIFQRILDIIQILELLAHDITGYRVLAEGEFVRNEIRVPIGRRSVQFRLSSCSSCPFLINLILLSLLLLSTFVFLFSLSLFFFFKTIFSRNCATQLETGNCER